MTLRPARTADAEFAFHVWKASMEAYVDATWGWNESLQRQRQQEEFAAGAYQIIEAEGRPIGTLIVRYTPDHIYLSGLYLLPESQRQGYGSHILERLLAEGQAHHLPVRLRVLKANPQARRLYERLGFAAINEEEHFVVMEKRPEEAMSEKVAVKIVSVTTIKENAVTTQMATLQDEAERQVKIYIGKCEAQALAAGLQEYAPDRPGTYDALLAAVSTAGGAVEEVCIRDIRNETFYALVSVRAGGAVQEVDMRPSDALNVAVRTGCPLFVSEKVFRALLEAEQSADVTEASKTQSVTVTKAVEPLALSAAEVSTELARMFAEDQSDRTEPSIDWDAVRPRDAARLGRVKQFYHGQALKTGMDFYHAAMILQHSPNTDDYLLAHEFCIAAISLGVEQAKWLAAASEDRFLMNIGRPQRFGTQYRVDKSSGAWSLYEVGTEVEDSLRRVFNVPSLSEAQAQADEMSKTPK